MERARYILDLAHYYLRMANDLMGALAAAILALVGLAMMVFLFPSATITLTVKAAILACTCAAVAACWWLVRDYVPAPKPKIQKQFEKL